MNNDHKLKQDILAELAWEPSISADHIGVTAKEGVVTLTGHVESYWRQAGSWASKLSPRSLKSVCR
jgi:osmotically-inducible protein OsmY